MATHTLTILPKVKSDSEGYSFLSQLAGESLQLIGQEVIIDFRFCSLFDGNLCAVLGNILSSLLERQNKLEIKCPRQYVREVLTKNGFLGRYVQGIKCPINFITSVPYSRFTLNDEEIANNFFKKQLFEKDRMLAMSSLAKKEISRSIFEVFINAVTHGGCEHAYCCGQFYLKKEIPRLVLTFADLGSTIKANVNQYLNSVYSGVDAIKWALTEGNTTKNNSIPGGLGLKLLQALIDLNKGKLQIVSSDGFIEIEGTSIREQHLPFSFPGTIVTVELLLNDPSFYILQSEEDESANSLF